MGIRGVGGSTKADGGGGNNQGGLATATQGDVMRSMRRRCLGGGEPI